MADNPLVISNSDISGVLKNVYEDFRINAFPKLTVLLAQMIHKTSRLVRAAFPDYKPDGTIPVWMLEKTNEIIILNQMVEWSFGPVTQDTIDAMPSVKFDALVQEVDRIYGQAPLPVKAASG